MIASVALVGLALAFHGYGRGVAVVSTPSAFARSVPGTAHPATTSSPARSTVSKPTGGPATTTGGPATSQQSTTSTSAPQNLGPLLSSTQYAPYAFQVYPGPVSQQARVAMAGFSVSVHSSGASETVSISAAGSTGTAQQSSYPAGDRVYFVETSLGDDSNAADYNGGDDGIIVTSSDGRIVQ